MDHAPRHTLLVRATHWINAVIFLALAVSGVAILLAYPRLHWGNDGSLGMPSLIDLPLPFVLELGIRGPGRSLHFLAAWLCLCNGLLYLFAGLASGHFRRDLLHRRSELGVRQLVNFLAGHFRARRSSGDALASYNPVQRLAYSAVVFVVFPFMFLTGLAMSPAITSVFPLLEAAVGGHQSARTLHFFAADLLLLFLVVHLAMLALSGFLARCRAMITGYHASPGRAR